MLHATRIRGRFRTFATSKRLTRVSYFSKSFFIFYFPMILDSPLKINLLCFPKEPCRKLHKCALFLAFSYTVKPPNSGHPKQRTCLQQRTKCLVPIVTIFIRMLTVAVLKKYMKKEVETVTFPSEFRAHLDNCHSQVGYCDKLLCEFVFASIILARFG